jgi:colanic acid/amylovoran biosynthesis glycosyltransferase
MRIDKRVAMRIGFFVNQYHVPSGTFFRREAAALEAAGEHIVRISLRDADGAPADAHPVHCLLGTRERHAALATSSLLSLSTPLRVARAMKLAAKLARHADKPWMATVQLAEAVRLKQLADREKLDHIHVHFGTNSTSVALLCRALGGPTFSFTAHGPEEFDHQDTLSVRLKCAEASAVVAVSSYGKSQLHRLMPVDAWHRVHVVPCVVDPMYVDGLVTKTPTVKRLVSVGRLAEQKGQLTLVHAAALLKERLSDFTIDVVGDGELRPILEREIARLGVQQHVNLLGWATPTDVKSHFENARALVLPSFAEGLPVVLMEAMATQRAAISTYIAGIPELLDATCGHVVPAGDVAALADAMHAVLTATPASLDAMGKIGRARVMERHVPHVAASLLQRMFAEAKS